MSLGAYRVTFCTCQGKLLIIQREPIASAAAVGYFVRTFHSDGLSSPRRRRASCPSNPFLKFSLNLEKKALFSADSRASGGVTTASEWVRARFQRLTIPRESFLELKFSLFHMSRKSTEGCHISIEWDSGDITMKSSSRAQRGKKSCMSDRRLVYKMFKLGGPETTENGTYAQNAGYTTKFQMIQINQGGGK